MMTTDSVLRASVLMVAIASTASAAVLPVAKLDRKTPVDFHTEIVPVLKANCTACHNKTTTKAGLQGFTLSVAADYAVHGVRANCIIVGTRSSGTSIAAAISACGSCTECTMPSAIIRRFSTPWSARMPFQA